MESLAAASDALEAIIEAGGSILYERYLAGRQAGFVAQRTLQDLKHLIAWELPTLDAEAPGARGWACEGEPLAAPLDTWARSALPTRAPGQPRADQAFRREQTPAELAAAAAGAAREAAEARAREERRHAPAAGAAAPSPAARARGDASSAVAASPSPQRQRGAGAGAQPRGQPRPMSQERKAAVTDKLARQALQKRLAGRDYTLDERGGVVLVDKVEEDALPPLSPQALSAVEAEGGGEGGAPSRAGGSLRSGPTHHSRRSGAPSAAAAAAAAAAQAAALAKGARAGALGEAGSVATMRTLKSAGGASVRTTLTQRQLAAKSDARYFTESLTLPQPSVTAALAAAAEALDALHRPGASVEASPPASARGLGAFSPSLSPGVVVTEGGRTLTGGGVAEDPRHASRAAVKAQAQAQLLGSPGRSEWEGGASERGDLDDGGFGGSIYSSASAYAAKVEAEAAQGGRRPPPPQGQRRGAGRQLPAGAAAVPQQGRQPARAALAARGLCAPPGLARRSRLRRRPAAANVQRSSVQCKGRGAGAVCAGGKGGAGHRQVT